ncbi:MAG: phenylalanine--tRNA ligase subunit beta [Candidatus Eremiobacteraeota bacterium]|nr:phenylalanine--tRNA ligase subunit beta [Candidatus Eremiobacteraeota bacterium]
MKVPLGWLLEYVDLPQSSKSIADALAQIGFPVDGIIPRPPLSGIVVGKITKLEKHPNADRLQIGTIDIGGPNLQIATAATNVAAGQVIPIATIGAQLANMKIERRKMRGFESEGMMCSAEELALPAEWFEDGIMQLDADTPLGADVVELFALQDDVLDVDITSNRVDAMSMIGLARELSAALSVPLKLPNFENPGSEPENGSAPTVSIESADCARFVIQRFTDIQVAVSPALLRVRLALAGQRPINNIVDISNYVMMETGQPLHFYDDGKIKNHHLIVRDAREGEVLKTLDDAEHRLPTLALVIADEHAAQGLAGLKGGKSAEVTDRTNAILLESANFSGPRIRRMSAALGFRSDASTRHEKALALSLTDIGAARAAQLLIAAGAHAAPPHAFGAAVTQAPPIDFNLHEVKRLLGFALTPSDMRRHLGALGFTIEDSGEDRFKIAPPLWRSDISIAADIVEELARMAGYAKIEAEIPPIVEHGISSQAYHLERKLARTMAALGYREIMSYSLHGIGIINKVKRAGIEPSAQAVQIRNPLSEDQRYLRYALGPPMLEYLARVNQPIRVFEIGHVFAQEDHISETPILSFGFTAEPIDEPHWRDSHFLALKGDCEALILQMTGCHADAVRDVRTGLHPGKTAVLMLDGREIASIGAADPRVVNSFGIRLPVYLGNIYLTNFPDYTAHSYTAPSRFPSTYRDLALLIAPDVSAAQITAAIRRSIGSLCVDARAFDEYRGPQIDPSVKSLTVRVILQKMDATITDSDADTAITVVLAALRDDFGARVRE